MHDNSWLRNAEHKIAKQANLYALGGFDHDALSVMDSQGNSFKTNWRDHGKQAKENNLTG